MGLETGDYISNLDSEFPLEADPTHEGNEHLQLIKNVLKMTFPGSGGGWTGPLTAGREFLNNLATLGIPGLITRTGSAPDEVVSIGATTDKATDVFTGGKNALVQNWEDGGIQSATVLNTANIVDFIYPIGSIIYREFQMGNPNTSYPETTWEAVSGRVLMGSGTWDDGTESKTFVGNTFGGKYSHTLTKEEIPPHEHMIEQGFNSNIGSGGPGAYAGLVQYDPPISGQEVRSSTGVGLDGDPHNIIQPYVVVDCWIRTA